MGLIETIWIGSSPNDGETNLTEDCGRTALQNQFDLHSWFPLPGTHDDRRHLSQQRILHKIDERGQDVRIDQGEQGAERMVHPEDALFIVMLMLPFRVETLCFGSIDLRAKIGSFRLLAFPFRPDVPAEEQTEEKGDEADSKVGKGDGDGEKEHDRE